MVFADALDPHPQGCIIRFEVVPGSSRLAVPSGFNPWRKSLEARRPGADSNPSNRQLIEELARVLGILESEIRVMKGEKSTRKLLLVKGMKRDMAVDILRPILELHR